MHFSRLSNVFSPGSISIVQRLPRHRHARDLLNVPTSSKQARARARVRARRTIDKLVKITHHRSTWRHGIHVSVGAIYERTERSLAIKTRQFQADGLSLARGASLFMRFIYSREARRPDLCAREYPRLNRDLFARRQSHACVIAHYPRLGT